MADDALQQLVDMLEGSAKGNTFESQLGLEATRNVFAAPYYQAERLRRQNVQVDPRAIAAAQGQQEFDNNLAMLETLIPLLEGQDSVVQGAAQQAGIPLNQPLFEQNVNERNLATRADATSSVGAGISSAAAGGADFNDLLAQLGFDQTGRVTPPSVQVAGINAANRGGDKAPTAKRVGFDAATGVQYTQDIPYEQANAAFDNMGIRDNSTAVGNEEGLSPEQRSTITQSIARQGGVPRGPMQAMRDANGNVVYVQRFRGLDGATYEMKFLPTPDGRLKASPAVIAE
jgi:hypothetical protein